jgi:hypothetical protein
MRLFGDKFITQLRRVSLWNKLCHDLRRIEPYGKVTSDYVNAVKNAITTMIAALPEITIKDEEDEFDSKEFKEEYEKIYRDVVEYTTPIIKALNGLPVYYRHHIKNGLVLGKGLKIYVIRTLLRNANNPKSVKRPNAMRVGLIRNTV